MKSKTYTYALIALGAAIIAVLAQLTIPLPLVPITGQTLAIGLVVTILGTRNGTLAVLVYILLGAAGLPVFAGFTGGLSKVVGPTGGYIVGFLPTALIMGIYLKKFGTTYGQAIVANMIGMVVTLAFGTAWLKIVAELELDCCVYGWCSTVYYWRYFKRCNRCLVRCTNPRSTAKCKTAITSLKDTQTLVIRCIDN